jgi:exodeoxyribonuclease VII small subunit
MGEMTFEQAFQRLEAILERMNAQDIPLEESLVLFEEANGLLKLCHKRLADAGQRIDVIIKNRQGDLTLSPTGQPQTTTLDVEGVPQ